MYRTYNNDYNNVTTQCMYRTYNYDYINVTMLQHNACIAHTIMTTSM